MVEVLKKKTNPNAKYFKSNATTQTGQSKTKSTLKHALLTTPYLKNSSMSSNMSYINDRSIELIILLKFSLISISKDHNGT